MGFKNLLYAEDDPNDVIIFNMVFKRATLPYLLHTVADGEAAIGWLSGKGEFADRGKFPLPDVLMLDLKMPKATGFEVLNWARAQKHFAKLPIIILSSSDMPNDVKRAYESGATTYFTKTHTYQDVLQFLRLLP
jgi:CheY-like chemotaxis protein